MAFDATAGGFDYRRIVCELEAITARRIEVGSWERFKAHAFTLGAEPRRSRAYDGVPVIEAIDLGDDQVRVCHETLDGRKWTTRYRIPEAADVEQVEQVQGV